MDLRVLGSSIVVWCSSVMRSDLIIHVWVKWVPGAGEWLLIGLNRRVVSVGPRRWILTVLC